MNNTINVLSIKAGGKAEICNQQIYQKDGVVYPKKWQREMSIFHDQKNLTITIAPTGSGKTVGMQNLLLYWILKNKKNKIVISCPSTQIGENFRETNIEGNIFPIDEKYCLTGDIENKSKIFKEFFNSDSRVMICTHSLLVANQDTILKNASENLSLLVDEAHHVKQSAEDESGNKIGRLIDKLLKTDCNIHFCTGTYHRGDCFQIVKNIKKWSVFEFPFHEYLDSCISFKGFNFNFSLVDMSDKMGWINEVGRLCRKKKKKTVIFLPHRSTKCAKIHKDKYEEVELVINSIIGRKTTIKERTEDKQGIITIDGIRIIQLISNQLKVKTVTIGDGSTLDVDYIIALERFQEGANWVECSRAIICGPRYSKNRIQQISGRTLRDLMKGSKDPEVIQILGKPKSLDDETIKDCLNDLLRHFAAIMVIGMKMKPVTKLEVDAKVNTTRVNSNNTTNYLDILPDRDQESAMAGLMEIFITLDDPTPKNYRLKAATWLESKYGLDRSDAINIANQAFLSEKSNLKGVHGDFSGFDNADYRKMKFLNDYGGCNFDKVSRGVSLMGVKNLSEARRILTMGEKEKDPAKYIAIAKAAGITNFSQLEKLFKKVYKERGLLV